MSGFLTSSPDCFLQVQLDNLPGMSLVAGKALSSARMSDAVLSQASLMGSRQFQDGEDEGKGPDTQGAPERFPDGPPHPLHHDCSPLLCKAFVGSHSIPKGFWTQIPFLLPSYPM